MNFVFDHYFCLKLLNNLHDAEITIMAGQYNGKNDQQ